ncbi:hypothetical protein BXY51_008712 [Actinoplanes cyaneus]|nr:hypothetical protein [Actinoplanes cyaneus]
MTVMTMIHVLDLQALPLTARSDDEIKCPSHRSIIVA